MGKYLFKFLIPAILLFLALPSLAGAQARFPNLDIFTEGGYSFEPGNMRLGRVELHPGLAFESRYESNIFDEADDGVFEGRTDDFIFTVKPSMGIELQRAPGEIFGFFADYIGKDENFLNEGGDLNFFNHKVGGGINLGGPGGRGDVTIGGSWEKRAGGGSKDFDSNIGTRQARRVTTGYVDLIYSISELFKLQIKADVEDEKFQGSKSENVDEYNAGGTLFWQATKLAAFGVRYNHKARRYEFITISSTNDDSDSEQVFLVLKWEPTSLISGEFAVGYETKRYNRFKGDNTQNFVYQIDALYRPVKRTRITFKSKREVVDSTFAAIQSYIRSTVQVRVSQKMGKKLRLKVGGGFENRDYRRSAVDTFGAVRTRIDNNYDGSAALIYKIQKWLEAKAQYKIEQNNSNFDTRDFINHIGLLEIAAKY